MSRVHLFEFEDQSWFPDFIRRGMTEFLHFCWSFFKLYKPIIPILEEAYKKSKEERFVDLCSGGGGPILEIQKNLSLSSEKPCSFILTDLYPNLPAFERIKRQSEGDVNYSEHSVNAKTISGDISGFRVIFSGFHHFAPNQAQKILNNAVSTGRPIAIFESTERHLITILGVFLNTTLGIFFITPFVRPFSVNRLIFTYLIPLIPLCLLWDGIVSCLRTYNVDELKELVRKLDTNDYHWDCGIEGPAGKRITYLIGLPK